MTALPSRLLVVTDRRLARTRLEDVVAGALDGGARWIWLRDRDLDPAERQALAQRLGALCGAHGATLSIGGAAHEAAAAGARAVHLPSSGDPAAARRALGPDALVGASAHSLDAAARACAAGADYATLSPVFETPSKPGYGPSIGLDALRAAQARRLRVVALGGIESARARACIDAGAAAVAVMGAVMTADSPARVVRDMLRAME